VTCNILLFLLISITGCGQEGQAPLGVTTTTTLPANLVLGQTVFTKNDVNLVDARGFLGPSGIAVDTANDHLYVADSANSRILVFNNISLLNSNGALADIVIGQPDFTSGLCNNPATAIGGLSKKSLCHPSAVAVDSAGNLYVADTGNNRVLGYDNPTGTCPTCDMTADRVFGQVGNFTTRTDNAGGLSPSSLSVPEGVAVDRSLTPNRLYVADTGNNRVLEYDTPLTDSVADRVFGQLNMSSKRCNQGPPATPPSASTLCDPQGMTVDGSGNLYVADTGNNRVLEYNTPLTTDATADVVIGQSLFTSNSCGASATALCSPTAVALDNAGNLYVADTSNSRVLEYTAPITTGETASTVFGQGGSFTAGNCNTPSTGAVTASTLCRPFGVALDSSNNLYLADTSNSRVLKYITPLTTNTVADLVLGQLVLTTNGINFVDAVGLNTPKGVAIDQSVTPNRLYIADTENNRVLGYSDISLLITGAAADIVIGQPDMNSNQCNQGGTSPSASTLCRPRGIAVDSTGNLYVADSDNNRVLQYDAAITTGMAATKVFGQLGSFTTMTCATANSRLCRPVGVALDGSNNLYVADTGNNRVLEYDTPITSDTTADRVFGQPDFTTSGSNAGGLSATSLSFPEGVAIDSTDNLYVADTGNNRVLEYDTPITSDTTADRVFGQPDFFSLESSPVSETSLFSPVGVALDSTDNLYVADKNNSRVLEYITPVISITLPQAGAVSASVVFGQPDFTANSCNNSVTAIGGLSNKSLCFSEGIATDGSGNLFVADTENHRVLQFPP